MQVSCRINNIIDLIVNEKIDSICVAAKYVRYVKSNSVRPD